MDTPYLINECLVYEVFVTNLTVGPYFVLDYLHYVCLHNSQQYFLAVVRSSPFPCSFSI
jgi:hypothetical protein